jgi:probable rRNA maturation factor
MPSIRFFQEDIAFRLPQIRNTRNWLQEVAASRHKTIADLNYIFTGDAYLHRLNLEYLRHDTFTDILTFDRSEQADCLSGDIYISLDRVRDNAGKFGQPFRDELHRVMVHGLLHLAGLNDGNRSEKEEMRKLENHYLALRSW